MSVDDSPFAPMYPIEFPTIVSQAIEGAEAHGFLVLNDGRQAGSTDVRPSCSIPRVGELLATLTTSHPGGRIVETGTGAGVGAAWISTGLLADATLTTYEIDASLCGIAAELFTERPDVDVVNGDWTSAEPADAAIDLLFLDGGPGDWLDPSNWERAVSYLRLGGMVVIDDVTPEELWPRDWRGTPDPKREFVLRNPLLRGTELRTTATTSVLLGTRIA